MRNETDYIPICDYFSSRHVDSLLIVCRIVCHTAGCMDFRQDQPTWLACHSQFTPPVELSRVGRAVGRCKLAIISARCNICISRLCYDVSVRLSVTEVHWRIRFQIPIPIYGVLRSGASTELFIVQWARGKGSSLGRVEGSSRAMLATARPSCYLRDNALEDGRMNVAYPNNTYIKL